MEKKFNRCQRCGGWTDRWNDFIVGPDEYETLQAKVEELTKELERYKAPLRELNEWAFDETGGEKG